MAEILTEVLDSVEEEAQFEYLEKVESDELLFPKLDGILLPIVIENAGVIAPCRWMGDVEVSLTVALNNYYQLMTEENADEVIMDVYEFLAHKLEPLEEIKEEVKQEPDQTTLVIEQLVELAPNENSEEVVNEAPIDVLQTHNDVAVEITAIPVISPVERQTPAKPLVIVEAMTAPRKATKKAESASDVPVHVLPILESREEITDIEEDVLLPVRNVGTEFIESPPLRLFTLESDRERRTDSQPTMSLEHVEEKSEDMRFDVSPTSVSKELESAIDKLPVEMENSSAVVEELTPEVLDGEIEKQGAREEQFGAAVDSMTDCPDVQDVRQEAEGALLVEAEEETESPSEELSESIKKIDTLLAGLDQSSESNESDGDEEYSALHEVVDVIAEMLGDLKLDETEAEHEDARDNEYTQERLIELYTALLENSSLENKVEVVSLLTKLTLELQIIKEDDDYTIRTNAHKKIKTLTVIVKKLKQAWNRIAAMGKLALRSHRLAMQQC